MEAVAEQPFNRTRTAVPRIEWSAVAAWLLPVALIVYLGMSNGGFGVVERSEAGIAVWWLILLGTLAGALPSAISTWPSRVVVGLLLAFGAWTAFSLGWTESAERTTVELGRVATYLGFLLLALAIQRKGHWRTLLHGVAVGIAILCLLALLSRLEPSWFPEQIAGKYLPGFEIERRLAYPINYSSGLGAMAAIGLPLLLAATSTARTILGQAAAAAALPLTALTLWLTASSLSVPVAAICLLAFLVLTPDRLPKLGTLLLSAGGAGVLLAAEGQRHALDRGLPTPLAEQQGQELMMFVVVVCAAVALAQAAISLAVRYGERPAWLIMSRQRAAGAVAVGLVAAVVCAAAVDLPATVSDGVKTFRDPNGSSSSSSTRASQILNPNSSGRYQFWQAAIDANATDPWRGIGPGTFEFWWSREGGQGGFKGFLQDAHSLYMESLAELGILGLVLVAGFILAVVGIGAVRTVRGPPELRTGRAAAAAGCVGFAVAAGLDWVWELAVLPAIFVVLAAVAVGAGAGTGLGRPPNRGVARNRRLPLPDPARLAVIGLAVAALVAIVLPLAENVAIEKSRAAFARGDLGAALSSARDAAAVQPYSATPRLQEALVFEQQGNLTDALAAARLAVRRETTNWRHWLVLSRLEARRGSIDAAIDDYRHARALNPRSNALVPGAVGR